MSEYELLTIENEGGNPVIRRRQADALFPERAAANAILRTVTGDPAVFSDGAAGRALRRLTARIEPVRDLNGYDRPWAAGGRNLIDPDAVTQDEEDTVWVFRSAPYPFFRRCNYVLSLQGGVAFDELAILGGDGETVLASVSGSGSGSAGYVSWKPTKKTVLYTPGMIRIRGEGIRAEDVAAHCQLEVGTAPTEWGPYENACPISGRTSVSLTHNGERVDVVLPAEAGTVYGGELDLTQGVLTVTGAMVTRTLRGHEALFSKIISVLYNGNARKLVFRSSYTVPEGCSLSDHGIVAASGAYYDPDRDGELTEHFGSDPAGHYSRTNSTGGQTETKGIFEWNKTNVDPGDVWYIRTWWKYADEGGLHEVYGEQQRFAAGEDYVYIPVQGWYEQAWFVNDRCRDYVVDDLPVSFKADGVQKSSLLPYNHTYGFANFFMEGTRLYAALPFAAAEDLENRPIQFYGELEEPLRFRLTPRQVTALLGENRISADCGPVTATYTADTETVIGEGLAADRAMVAAEAPDSTAARTYAVGDYLTVGDGLYRVTAAIAEGESVQPGVNAERTTVGEELAALFALIAPDS